MTPAEITAGVRQAMATADGQDARRLAQQDTEARAAAWNILMSHAENLDRKSRAVLAAMLEQSSRITPNRRAGALMQHTASRLDATLVDRP